MTGITELFIMHFSVMVNKKNRVAKELYYVKEYKRALAEYSQLIGKVYRLTIEL